MQPHGVEVWEGRVLAAARAMAGLTVRDLAAAAQVDKDTVSRLEAMPVIEITPLRRHGYVARETWAKIVAALSTHGVELLPAGEDHGGGVRLAKPSQR